MFCWILLLSPERNFILASCGNKANVCTAISRALALIFCSVMAISFDLIIGEFCGAVYEGLRYFLALLLASGSAAFLGLPLPGTLRIASTTEGSYRALYDNGFIPSFSIRLWAVFHGIPSSFAISSIVIPFITSLSANLLKILNNVDILRYLLHISKVEFVKKIKNIVLYRNLILTNIVLLRYFYSMS